MRRTRWLLLLLMFLIIAGVGVTYNLQRKIQEQSRPAQPAKLPEGLIGQASDWTWSHTGNGKSIVEIKARDWRQLSDSNQMELEGVVLRVHHKDQKAYDEVKSAKAVFDTKSRTLVSEGEVEITMGVPADGEQPKPTGRLLHIKSSGVRYESDTGKATTDRPASFNFDRGEGSSTGAEYDPTTRELKMIKDVRLKWTGTNPKQTPMEVEAGSLVYKEAESKVYLSPWAKLKRANLTLEAGDSVVTLEEGIIRNVEAAKAHGSDEYPKRKIQYQAETLAMNFDAEGRMSALRGDNSARLVSTSDSAETTITAQRVDLEFEAGAEESTLKKAISSGNSVVESKPVPRSNVLPPDTRIIRSDTITLDMKPGGEEVEKVETHAPGVVEFIPNRPGQKRRELKADRMTIQYAEHNQIRSFRAFQAATRTERETPKGKPPAPPALTWSKEMSAEFDPKTGQMTRMEQWDNFRYEEGDRRAKADKAVLEHPSEKITLAGAARVSDTTGTTDADTIVFKQLSGDMEASGNVATTRVPDKKKKTDGGMMAGDDPIQARAKRMTTAEENNQIRYEGGATLWQGANRIEADQIHIDRENQVLEAHGSVVSQFLDKPKAPLGKNAAPKGPVFTIVKAPHLLYEDKNKVAHYTGGVLLNRPGMRVDSKELRAFLKNEESDSSLEKAHADGTVRIVQTTPDRTRTGTSEHAEYYVEEEMVMLEQGQPQLVDSVRGTTRGKRLTYFAGSDKLQVDGAEAQPAVSKIRRK